jgi:hypothetical protein
LFLGLSFCVFTWGLQYKLSLYDPPQAVSHAIPEAKLLSGNERSTTSESPLVKKTSISDRAIRMTLFSLLFVFLLAINLKLRQVLNWKDSDMSQPQRLPSQAGLTAFFFRPPPAIA